MRNYTKPILVVDDNKNILRTFEKLLNLDGLKAVTESDPLNAADLLEKHNFDIVICDINMPRIDGIELTSQLLKIKPELLVIMVTAAGSEQIAVKAMKAGAWHYLSKPVNPDEFSLLIERACSRIALIDENAWLKSEQAKNKALNTMIGTSTELEHIRQLLERVAPTSATILITGESGTGKELVAKAAHELSPRASKRFVAINCAAIPESLLESELFGYEKGAFTGASTSKPGKFEIANEGTIFLDEIGEMSRPLQGKLLRVLQESEVERLGSSRATNVDVRVIAATNLNLENEIEAGNFREDLYYRINVIELKVPSLRDRTSDIPLLIKHFISEFSTKYNKPCEELRPEILNQLTKFLWPGNIRQLRNCIERAVILGLHDISSYNILQKSAEKTRETLPMEASNSRIPTLKEIQLIHVENVMVSLKGNKAKVSRALGIDPKTLRTRLKELEDMRKAGHIERNS